MAATACATAGPGHRLRKVTKVTIDERGEEVVEEVVEEVMDEAGAAAEPPAAKGKLQRRACF